MKSALSVLLLVFAAPSLFNSASESKWTVTKGSSTIGTITLLTSANGTRAEFRSPSGAITTLLGGNNSVWLRSSSGDVDLATISATTPETTSATALLLPYSPTKSDAVTLKNGMPATYKFRGATATYTYDTKGAAKVDLDLGGQKYTLTRTSVSSSNADASTFAIRSKKSAASKLARLSGDLLGSSDNSVSATSGPRGVGHPGMALKDGGDYAALKKLETRDTAWKEKMDAALAEFQKSGKVGKSREDQ